MNARVENVVSWLKACADDPMWADHAEVPKALCASAADLLEQLKAENAALKREAYTWWAAARDATKAETDNK
jgi:hypothetical protein